MDYLGITVPVALHLDHGSFEGAKRAIEDVDFAHAQRDRLFNLILGNAGAPMQHQGNRVGGFEENIEKSKQIIELAHAKGISVECEVGGIGGTEDGKTSAGELADPKECADRSPWAPPPSFGRNTPSARRKKRCRTPY